MNKDIIIQSEIAARIHIIRGKKVMFDADLAKFYNVSTKYLNKMVTRNLTRFPEDFMFQLSSIELNNLRFQIGTSSWGGRRYLPRVFSEHGILMLSSVLRSNRAIQVNIQIMRTFIKLRELILTHKDLKVKIEKLEKKYKNHDEKIAFIFEAVKQLLEPSKCNKEYKIGFKSD